MLLGKTVYILLFIVSGRCGFVADKTYLIALTTLVAGDT